MIKTAFVYGPYLALPIALGAFFWRFRPCAGAGIAWSLALAVCFSKFLAYRTFGGDAFNPQLPQLVIWIWNWAYSGAMIFCALALLALPFRLPRPEWILPLAAWAIALWGVWNGIRPPVVREVTLAYDGLPAALDGYRIVHLTDLHVSSAARSWRTERIVAAANACGGDLIVLTGDLTDGLPDEREADASPLAGLRARDGVYAVTGNHEGYFKFPLWRPLYERWGLRFLDRDCVFPHAGLALGGIGDYAVSHRFSCGRTFEAATNGEFRVLLQHRPSGAGQWAAGMGVRLQLSGHTHGGVCPGMAEIVRRYNGGFVRGVYELSAPRRACLYVSPGAGQWAGFPVRFFNPTEITVFTLKAASEK